MRRALIIRTPLRWRIDGVEQPTHCTAAETAVHLSQPTDGQSHLSSTDSWLSRRRRPHSPPTHGSLTQHTNAHRLRRCECSAVDTSDCTPPLQLAQADSEPQGQAAVVAPQFECAACDRLRLTPLFALHLHARQLLQTTTRTHEQRHCRANQQLILCGIECSHTAAGSHSHGRTLRPLRSVWRHLPPTDQSCCRANTPQ